MLHAIAGAVALVAVFSHSEFTRWLVRTGRAACSVYLRVQMNKSADGGNGEVAHTTRRSFWHICYQGVNIDLLKPKT